MESGIPEIVLLGIVSPPIAMIISIVASIKNYTRLKLVFVTWV